MTASSTRVGTSTERPRVVPLQLGCCPSPPRCDLCARQHHLDAELVEAHLIAARDRHGGPLRATFFGGPPPSDELLEALEGVPFSVRVRPDLLSRAEARRLADRGCEAVELDALTLHDPSLRAVHRRYRGALVLEMLKGLPSFGLRAGIVLAPGLPRSSYEGVLDDAHAVAPLVSTARLHPVLVLQGSGLQQVHMDGLYEPLSVAQAVTVCRGMMEVLEAHDVEVVRVGQNPSADELGRCVAGPDHSSLRELVEAMRAREVVTALLAPMPVGQAVVVRCAPADEARAHGPNHGNIVYWRSLGPFASVDVVPDPRLQRGMWRVEEAQ